MKPRINLMNLNPAIIHAMLGLERQVSKAGLDNKLLNLVRMRASQINGVRLLPGHAQQGCPR
jgi:hypothetical protein